MDGGGPQHVEEEWVAHAKSLYLVSNHSRLELQFSYDTHGLKWVYKRSLHLMALTNNRHSDTFERSIFET